MGRIKQFAISGALGLGLVVTSALPNQASAQSVHVDGVRGATIETVGYRNGRGYRYGRNYRTRDYYPSRGRSYYYSTPRYRSYYSTPYQPRYRSYYRYPGRYGNGYYRSDTYRGAVIGGNIGSAIGGWRGGQIGAAIGAAVAD